MPYHYLRTFVRIWRGYVTQRVIALSPMCLSPTSIGIVLTFKLNRKFFSLFTFLPCTFWPPSPLYAIFYGLHIIVWMVEMTGQAVKVMRISEQFKWLFLWMIQRKFVWNSWIPSISFVSFLNRLAWLIVGFLKKYHTLPEPTASFLFFGQSSYCNRPFRFRPLVETCDSIVWK